MAQNNHYYSYLTYQSLTECSAHQARLYIYKINKNKHLQLASDNYHVATNAVNL